MATTGEREKVKKGFIGELPAISAQSPPVAEVSNGLAAPTHRAIVEPGANVKAVWPPEVQVLMDWFMKLEPPETPFYLEPHLHIIDPVKFFSSFRREIQTGPKGPRARMGTLQSDLRMLKACLN